MNQPSPSENKSRGDREQENSNFSSEFYGDGLEFNEALDKTMFNERYQKKYPDEYTFGKRICCGMCFQMMVIFAFILIANAKVPILFGLSFLEKVPKHFTCLRQNPETGEEHWTDCKKEQICDEGLSKDQYQPDTSDPEYLDNWVNKFDLLCEPKYKIGLIGSMYFIGIITTLTFVPIIADKCGRKWVFCITVIIQVITQVALLISTNIYELYVFEFLWGTTFAGRTIIGISYVIEFLTQKDQETFLFYFMFTINLFIYAMTIWYQFIDNCYFNLQLVIIFTTALSLLFFLIFVPESTKWQYTYQQASEAKDSIQYISRVNNMPKRQQEKLKDLKWDFETKVDQRPEGSKKNDDNELIIARQRALISDSTYAWNVVKLSILWTVASFSNYMLSFMNKYFEGSIFLNFYLDATAGIVAATLSLILYKYLRMRWSFIIGLILSFIGGFFLLMFQQDYLDVTWVRHFQTSNCPYPEASEQERQYYLSTLIPAVVFFTKVGLNSHFQNCYTASFGDILFPFYKKATAIGICNLIARTVTIFSSLAAELERPIPLILLLSGVLLALITSIFLPSIEDEDNFRKLQKEIDEGADIDEVKSRSTKKNE